MIDAHIRLLKEAIIHEFYRLYEQHAQDHIYACALVVNPYFIPDYLVISTERSLFCEVEESGQYLAHKERWQTAKWRYHSQSADSAMTALKTTFGQYFQQTHLFGQPWLEQKIAPTQNHSDFLFTALQQAKDTLHELYGLEIRDIVFFISLHTADKIELLSAQALNPPSTRLNDFLRAKASVGEVKIQNHHAAKMKLAQPDKDLLTDLAQIILLESYDYLEVAQRAYLLTLESHFVDANRYVQKIIQSIAALDTQNQDSYSLSRQDILLQIEKLQNPNLPILIDRQNPLYT